MDTADSTYQGRSYKPASPHPSEKTDDHQRKMAFEEIRESAERLKSSFLDEMEVKLTAVMDDVMHTIQKADVADRYSESPSTPPTTPNKEPSPRKLNGKFPEKVFVSRPSPLTELLQVTHFKTIHHMFIASLILIMLHTMILDLVEKDKVDLGLVKLMWAFGRLQLTLTILLALEFCGLVVLYPAFHFWSRVRLKVKPESTKMIDYLAALSFLIFLTGMICIPGVIMWHQPLPPASGATVTMEQCRLLMKIYAFVRSNVPRILKQRKSDSDVVNSRTKRGRNSSSSTDKLVSSTSKENDEDNQEAESEMWTSSTRATPQSPSSVRRRRVQETERREDRVGLREEEGPSYSKYLYFYMAPTLIYKDSYPRTSHVRWEYVCWNFAQVLGCIVYANFILCRYSTAYFINFGHPDHPMTVLQFCNAVFSMMLPGTLGLVLGFYLLLHSWHNAFAEMLCFGDRLFYKDWWNSSSFQSYYRTWNILVHDWLHTYIFKDAWECGLAKYSKALPTILVFVISSLFHEYILSFSFNFFFPVLLTLFGGFGMAFNFVKTSQSALGNIFMWLCLIAGSGILVSTYTMEFYARINCPVLTNDDATDFFTPRFWSCNAIVWN